jgi:hypothetical protein
MYINTDKNYPVGSLLKMEEHLFLFLTAGDAAEFYDGKSYRLMHEPIKHFWADNTPVLVLSKKPHSETMEVWQVLHQQKLWWIAITGADLVCFKKLL